WGGYIFADFLDQLPDFPISGSNDGDLTPDGIGDSANKKPFANAATFALSLGLSDPFGREGDLLGFVFGMPPKLVDAGPETQGTPVPFFEIARRGEPEVPVTDNNNNLDTVGIVGSDNADLNPDPNLENRDGNILPKKVGVKDDATSLHFEVFYRFKVNDNISITPGVVVVTNPGHIEDNDTLYVGTIRTTFRF
ncbi:MAG: carbohydrate porin, partial [Xenococcaceae cyanobacterium]